MEKPTLSQLQQWMSRAIANPCEIGQTGETENAGLNWIQGDEKASREQRLSVYSTAYLIRLTEVFQSDFSAVHSVLGDEAFTQLTSDYLKAYPSRFTNIGEVARNFALFLETHLVIQERPFLPALASLEWNINESFWADDLPYLDFSRLAHLSEEQWGRARFNLDSSVKLIQSDWAVYPIWKGSEGVEYPRTPVREYLMIHRDAEGDAQVSELTETSYEALQSIKSGRSLEELFESYENERLPESPTGAQVQSWFQEWIQKGIIREIVLT